jgi:hypothetical protein
VIFDLCEGVCDRLSQRMQQRAREFDRLKAFTLSK